MEHSAFDRRTFLTVLGLGTLGVAAGARAVWLTGPPASSLPELAGLGLAGTLAQGCDVPAVLHDAFSALGEVP